MSTMALPSEKRSIGEEKFAAAMRIASELEVKTRSLLDQIRPYAEADDPFEAMVAAHDRAEAFEVDQERRIFLGPPNGK